ncbi:hypothetical protein FJY93_02755 [Candidatus Kaiserbacteria bacterium]|nr:hypothetical protein [Candidatus Kaiserbacteria bacterium]
MKNISTTVWIIGIVAVIAALFAWSAFLQPSDPDVIARRGLHSHPQLAIYVKGEKVEIPQNIGLGAVHQPMHTHEDLPLIHLEFQGVVRKGDIMLGQFFKIWGKDMRQFGSNMRMTVNGKENTEYENYIMRDNDKIELQYD